MVPTSNTENEPLCLYIMLSHYVNICEICFVSLCFKHALTERRRRHYKLVIDQVKYGHWCNLKTPWSLKMIKYLEGTTHICSHWKIGLLKLSSQILSFKLVFILIDINILQHVFRGILLVSPQTCLTFLPLSSQTSRLKEMLMGFFYVWDTILQILLFSVTFTCSLTYRMIQYTSVTTGSCDLCERVFAWNPDCFPLAKSASLPLLFL